VPSADSELTRDELLALLRAKDEHIALIQQRLEELEGLVVALTARLGRDSSNSSRPPSSDSPFVKKPAAKRSVRAKSGKRPGRQPGSGGTTLRLVDDPDETVTEVASECGRCGDDLRDAPVFEVQRRQVVDVPPLAPKPYVTEYRICSVACPRCAAVTEPAVPGVASGRVQYGPRVKARAAWLVCGHFLPVRRAASTLNALLGFSASTGFLASVRAQAARLLETGFLPAVRELIASAPVAHADETTARAAGALTYLHVACTDYLTAMHVGDRSARTIDAGGIWPEFRGVLVRDGYSGYAHLEKIEHAWCGIHLIRDLRAVNDPDPAGRSWAAMMVNTLLIANRLAHRARAHGRDRLSDDDLGWIKGLYHGALATGRTENDVGRDPLHEQARTLMRRFARHEAMILRFALDLAVPFTNNTAELPARAVKVQQRTSGGCWRTLQGLIDFAVVQSYPSTATKWGKNTLDVLEQLFTTGPWIPGSLTPA
jgi:transposase